MFNLKNIQEGAKLVEWFVQTRFRTFLLGIVFASFMNYFVYALGQARQHDLEIIIKNKDEIISVKEEIISRKEEALEAAEQKTRILIMEQEVKIQKRIRDTIDLFNHMQVGINRTKSVVRAREEQFKETLNKYDNEKK